MLTATVLLSLTLMTTNPPVSEFNQAHWLRTGDLAVEVVLNAEELRGRFGTRFAEDAFVRNVLVDGYPFVHPHGLADEFGINGDGVFGYEDAGAGDPFMKMGVGVLARKDAAKDYHFGHRYPMVEDFPVWLVERTTTKLRTRQEAAFNGWAYTLERTYEVSAGNALSITYHVRNIGAKPLVFEHYNHHWFTFDRHPIGPDYILETSFPLSGGKSEKPELLTIEPNTLKMQPLPADARTAYYATPEGGTPNANALTLRHATEGAAVHLDGDYPLHRMAMYAEVKSDTYCPEIFSWWELAPEEEATWTMHYRFSRDDD